MPAASGVDIGAAHDHAGQQRRDVENRTQSGETEQHRRDEDQPVVAAAAGIEQFAQQKAAEKAEYGRGEVVAERQYHVFDGHAGFRAGAGDCGDDAEGEQTDDVVESDDLQQRVDKIAPRVILANRHHRARRRRRCGDCPQNQGKAPRKRKKEMRRNGHQDAGEKRLGEGDDDDLGAGGAKNFLFKKLPDAESDKCQRHVADKPHAADDFDRHRAEDIGADEYAGEDIPGDVGQAQQLGHARDQKAA